MPEDTADERQRSIDAGRQRIIDHLTDLGRRVDEIDARLGLLENWVYQIHPRPQNCPRCTRKIMSWPTCKHCGADLPALGVKEPK